MAAQKTSKRASAKSSQKNRSKAAGNRSVSKKQQLAQANQQSAPKADKQENKLKRFFIVAISVIVALGLMIPVAGIGVASCSANSAQTSQQSTDPQ